MMTSLDNFIRQHKDILKEVKYMEEELSKSDYKNNLSDLALHISILAGKISIHLTSEDKFLYPDLLSSSNKALKNMAVEYTNEMGHILASYIDYKNKFNTKSKILDNIDVFTKETKGIFNAIKNRIEKEEKELYRLVESENN